MFVLLFTSAQASSARLSTPSSSELVAFHIHRAPFTVSSFEVDNRSPPPITIFSSLPSSSSQLLEHVQEVPVDAWGLYTIPVLDLNRTGSYEIGLSNNDEKWVCPNVELVVSSFHLEKTTKLVCSYHVEEPINGGDGVTKEVSILASLSAFLLASVGLKLALSTPAAAVTEDSLISPGLVRHHRSRAVTPPRGRRKSALDSEEDEYSGYDEYEFYEGYSPPSYITDEDEHEGENKGEDEGGEYDAEEKWMEDHSAKDEDDTDPFEIIPPSPVIRSSDGGFSIWLQKNVYAK